MSEEIYQRIEIPFWQRIGGHARVSTHDEALDDKSVVIIFRYYIGQIRAQISTQAIELVTSLAIAILPHGFSTRWIAVEGM